MACPICKQRKGKRNCPAKGESICSLCCGREREETIACPLACVYLQDARAREAGALRPEAAAHPDVRIERAFVADHEELIKAVAQVTALSAMAAPGCLDKDVREALDAVIRTRQAVPDGGNGGARPGSACSSAVFDAVNGGLEEFRDRKAEDVVKALVFLLRMAQDRDNGRAMGRGFLHLLARQFDMEKQTPAASAAQSLS